VPSRAVLVNTSAAYVKLGRLDDARRVPERRRPLDAARARELDEVIAKGK
jgi:hypothetical protein